MWMILWIFMLKLDEKIFYCGFIINFIYGILSICGSIFKRYLVIMVFFNLIDKF